MWIDSDRSPELDFVPFHQIFDEAVWPSGFEVLRNYAKSLRGLSLKASADHNTLLISLPLTIDHEQLPAEVVPLIDQRLAMVGETYAHLLKSVFDEYEFSIISPSTLAEIDHRLIDYEKQREALRLLTLWEKVSTALGIYHFL